MTLAELLHPSSVGHFIVNHFGSRPLHIPGGAGRFGEMVEAGFDPWPGASNSRSLTLLTRDIERTLDAVVTTESIACAGERLCLEQDYFLFQADGDAVLRLWQSDQEESEAPAAVIDLSSGDVIYIPRGWWLSCAGSSGSSQRPAIGIRNPNGRDLLAWLFDRLKQHDFFDRDLPRFAAPAVQADYLTALRRTIAGACRVPGLFQLYTRSDSSFAPSRASIRPERDMDPSPESVVDFLARRRLYLWRPNRETFAFKFAGNDLHFPIDAAELIGFLEARSPVRLADFHDAFADEFDREDLTDFVADLARQGLVAIMRPTDE